MSKEPRRQLAAIMFTDIVGYSALMQQDEKKAIKQRTKHREVFNEKHEQFDGRILQYYGDGTLSVFSSAVNASKCAIEIQKRLQDGAPVQVRIGLHLGDIIFDKTEVYGDAVNLAARIEGLAIGGSILLSNELNNELKNKTSIDTIHMGSYHFKNMEKTIDVFAMDDPGLIVPKPSDLSGKLINDPRSIAVLPFVNMSADLANNYFSDGITEEIINALSKIENLRVTSRTSSFYFKNKVLPIKKIAQELNVSAILEGSVRIAGRAVRITAQLIQADGDYHFWSETWDRKLENIFEIQDEISLLIADKLREQFGHFEIQDHLVEKQTMSLKTYECYLKGRFLLNKWNPVDTKKAIEQFSEAIKIDDQHAKSYAGLADSYSFLGTTGFMPYVEAWKKANEFLLQAQNLDNNLAEVNYQLANEAFFIEGDYPKSLREMKSIVSSRPSFSKAHQYLSFLYIIAGDRQNSRKHIDLALDIDPKSEETKFFKGYFYYMIGESEEAIRFMDDCIAINDKNIPAHSIKATALLLLKRYDEAIEYFETIPKEVVIPEEMNGVKFLGHFLRGDKTETDFYHMKIKELLKGHNAITASSFIFMYLVLSQDMDAAFDWLNGAIRKKSYVPAMRISDPLVSELRTDSRYSELMQNIFQSNKTAEQSASKKKALMDRDLANETLLKLLNHLKENKAYLNPDLSLRLLAKDLSIHPNQLSWLINEHLNKNFNDLINQYRIEEFKTLAIDPSNAGITILGLAYDSGFNSKTVFNSYFKKVTGQTPKQFLKSQ